MSKYVKKYIRYTINGDYATTFTIERADAGFNLKIQGCTDDQGNVAFTKDIDVEVAVLRELFSKVLEDVDADDEDEDDD